MSRNWLLEPAPVLQLAEYRAAGGYTALEKALAKTPGETIDEVTASGLTGRGGAAFSVGRKWLFVYTAEGEEKYVVCNADEGEAGTYKDRELLRNSPFKIIEGMTIAAYAVGAVHGILFCRGEYRWLQGLLRNALGQAREAGLLGKSILGRGGFDFDIELVGSAGAYICGEETALLNALEGRRGEPRNRPPFPANSGAYAKPTLINNVETFAIIPYIFQVGADAFSSTGTKDSTGHKLLTLSGNIKHPGVYEVELGAVTIRDLIYGESYGGGTADARPAKACHFGGQSAPLAFPEQFNTPVDHLNFKAAGLSIGTGAVVVLGEDVCLVDYCRKVMEFFVHESCGRCVPCRVGTKRVTEMLEQLLTFHVLPGFTDQLEAAARAAAFNPACGLGKSAFSCLLSAIGNRRGEFTAHEDLICPAGKCGGRNG